MTASNENNHELPVINANMTRASNPLYHEITPGPARPASSQPQPNNNYDHLGLRPDAAAQGNEYTGLQTRRSPSNDYLHLVG